MSNFFQRLGHAVGHDAKVVGHDVKVVAKDTAHVAEKVTAKGLSEGITVAEKILPLIPVLPAPAVFAVEAILKLVNDKLNEEGNTMNPLETFAITVVLGILQSTVKNPAHAALLRNQLVGIANNIYAEYGLTPPTAAPVTDAAAAPVTTGK